MTKSDLHAKLDAIVGIERRCRTRSLMRASCASLQDPDGVRFGSGNQNRFVRLKSNSKKQRPRRRS